MICALPVQRGPFRGLMEATGTIAGVSRHKKAGEKPCRPCAAAASADMQRRYWAVTEAEREIIRVQARRQQAQFRAANPDVIRRRKREWAQANPEYVSTAARATKLRKYGLTPEDYEAILEAQGGECAVCGTTVPGPNSRNFDVDHDHSCCAGDKSCGACIRGLLCRRCNTGLGWFGDDSEALIAAAAYLMERGGE